MTYDLTIIKGEQFPSFSIEVAAIITIDVENDQNLLFAIRLDNILFINVYLIKIICL
jgi:hypothetical protein